MGIGYSSDLLKAKNVLKKIFEENPGIMKDYWTAKWSITEAIKLTFDKEGIEIPYQYMNVMMTKES